MDYSSLAIDQQISCETLHLDQETVANFRNAVGDNSLLCVDNCSVNIVPPMAAAALSFRSAIKALSIPGGTLHITQEIQFYKIVNVGDIIQCEARIRRNSVRRELRFIQIEIFVTDQAKEKVLAGKSTITIPHTNENE